MRKLTLDLINRQKAENEELRKKVNFLQASNNLNQSLLEKEKIEVELAKAETEIAKSEARKEFADLSIKRICEQVSAPTPSESYIVERCNQEIYNLLKEMESDDNGE